MTTPGYLEGMRAEMLDKSEEPAAEGVFEALQGGLGATPFEELVRATKLFKYRDWVFTIQKARSGPVNALVAWVEFDTTDARTGEPVHYKLGNTLPVDTTPKGLMTVFAAAVFHAEDHETREFIKFGDGVPFDPHSGPNAVT